MGRFFKILGFSLVSLFALIGFVLTSLFVASYFHLTDVNGNIDGSTYLLSSIAHKLTNKPLQTPVVLADSVSADKLAALQDFTNQHMAKYCRLKVLSYFAPDNAQKIYTVYLANNSDMLLENMLSAISQHLQNDHTFDAAIDNCNNSGSLASEQLPQQPTDKNVFAWYNDHETWGVLQAAMLKDKPDLEEAAQKGGIDVRMLIAPLFVEQWREYTSERELFKTLLKPLQTFATSTSFSLGPMNIKEDIAIQIEQHLKDHASPYYLGPQYEHLLDFTTADAHKERFARMTSYTKHYYSYLYAALYLAQLEKQWSNQGYRINNRPEIVATLFNIGFSRSRPNANPAVGGAEINVAGEKYTFGKLAYEFYYSGELVDSFPYPAQK